MEVGWCYQPVNDWPSDCWCEGGWTQEANAAPWEQCGSSSSSTYGWTKHRAPSDDSQTVSAVAALIHWGGGRRPASAVGLLYSEAGGLHKRAIRAHGGLGKFVEAHPDVFVLEPAGPGDACPWLRLVSEEERFAAQPKTPKKVEEEAEPCRFFRKGRCLKGAGCRFSHLEEYNVEKGPESDLPREDQIRLQTLYYLSDENLRHDAFFQGIMAGAEGGWVSLLTILGCRKLQSLEATLEEVLEALRDVEWLELREFPAGSEAVRRRTPPPQLEERSSTVTDAPNVLEPSLTQKPLTLLHTRKEGWQAVVEDHPRRSFCFVKRNRWPLALLQQEYELLRSKVQWHVLRNRSEDLVTRSTAWFVAPGCACPYAYGSTMVEPKQKPEWLREIEARVLEEGCGLPKEEWPNSVNLNLYETEEQNVGWHADDEGLFRGCERDCCIISASWGAVRNFQVALKDRCHTSGRLSIFRSSVRSIALMPGDLCSMEGLFQRHYSHQLAKGLPHPGGEPKIMRINLTWRHIVSHKPFCPHSWTSR